jgi:nitrite reductase/ring-hydroxylating ferredoxin subunit
MMSSEVESKANSHAGSGIYICAAAEVEEGGKGVRFPVQVWGDATTGFVVRYDGQLHAYLNRCAHVPIELDWEKGTFFESSGLYIMCSTHGAIYVPETGFCAGGPCKGGRLRKIALQERDGDVFWQPDDMVLPQTEEQIQAERQRIDKLLAIGAQQKAGEAT